MSTDSFKLVPLLAPQDTPTMNPMTSVRHLPLTHGTTSGDSRRKVFVGGIGTELTSKDLIKAFRSVGMDIINKPVRILRGKKFNFAPSVELKTEEQRQKMIEMRQLEVGGSTLEIRAHRNVRKKVRNKKNPRMAQEVREALCIERRNKLKLKLYELKLMEAENLLLKAKIDREIRACQNALQEGRRYSRSYTKISTANKPAPSVSSQNIKFDSNLTQAQKQYLKNFKQRTAIETEQRFALERKMNPSYSHQEMIIARSYTRMDEYDKSVESVHDQFNSTEKKLAQEQTLSPQNLSKKHSDMSISSPFRPSSLALDDEQDFDPPLVENMGSLANGSIDHIFEQIDEKEKLKKVQMKFENSEKQSRDTSQILLLVKDDIDDEIKIEDVMSFKKEHEVVITAH